MEANGRSVGPSAALSLPSAENPGEENEEKPTRVSHETAVSPVPG
jgi:hypothetical protein